MSAQSLSEPWASVGGYLRRRGLRWTPQRRQIIEVLAESSGHVTGAEIVERCRERDVATVPSTVYRTLDVLEELGLIRHGHGADGREEYHIRPTGEHGHLYCDRCGRQWELDDTHLRQFVSDVELQNRFSVDLSHVTVVGRCADCVAAEPGEPVSAPVAGQRERL
jgi:Fur family ferric uptake transcriptional regulator